jgi:NADPH:quinone reductase-like Zn-dependent oxidoreductase
MKAALCEDNKLVLKDLPIPTVIKGSVLVKNHVSAVNFADQYQISRGFALPPTNIIGEERYIGAYASILLIFI